MAVCGKVCCVAAVVNNSGFFSLGMLKCVCVVDVMVVGFSAVLRGVEL